MTTLGPFSRCTFGRRYPNLPRIQPNGGGGGKTAAPHTSLAGVRVSQEPEANATGARPPARLKGISAEEAGGLWGKAFMATPGTAEPMEGGGATFPYQEIFGDSLISGRFLIGQAQVGRRRWELVLCVA